MITKALDFDDILLVPESRENNDTDSREQIDISTKFFSYDKSKVLNLDVPIIGSPMKGIISPNLIVELGRLGGIGILHRFYTDRNLWVKDISYIKSKDVDFGVAVGLDDDYYKDALDFGARIICLDVANGYLVSVKNKAQDIKSYIERNNFDAFLMAGNVVTYEGTNGLIKNGVDMIRVGIGSGSLCTTRKVTGVGVPQIYALTGCRGENKDFLGHLVSDGGIRNSGDAVKAFVFGASAVMLGSILATTFESANNGIIFGMASRKLQEEYYHGVKSIEGIEKELTSYQSLEDFINEFVYGIKSACTYLNKKSVEELGIKGANFYMV